MHLSTAARSCSPPERADSVAMYASVMLRGMHIRLGVVNLLCGLLPDFGSGAVRGRLYRLIGFDVGPGAFLMGNLQLVSGTQNFYSKLHIGEGCVIGDHVTINVDADVRLGSRVSISPHALIYTGTHLLGPGSNRRVANVVARPVVIEDGCWLGLGAMILPGVTVGHGSVVAAGAVVCEDVPADSYVQGNPAVVVRRLPWGDR